MCLAVPMKVVSIDNDMVIAEIDGVRREASLMMLDEDADPLLSELRVLNYRYVQFFFHPFQDRFTRYCHRNNLF